MSQRKPPDDASTRAFSHGEGEEEPAVRIGRNVITGGNPAASPGDRTRPLGAEPPPAASPRPAPRPAPYPEQRVSAKATLLMTEANPQSQAAKAASGRAPAQRAEPPNAMSAGRQAGGGLSQQDAEMPERPRTSVQPRKVAAAPAASGRPAAPKSARPPESTQPLPASGSDTEPLRLQLDAGDMLEQRDAAPGPDGVPSRGPGLVIGIVVVAVIAAGAGVWYGMSSHEKPAAEVPPTRNETQLTPAGTAQPGTPPANAANPIPGQVPAQTAVPAAPVQQPAAAAPVAAPAAKPAATEPHAAEPSAAATTAPSPGKASARKPKRRGGGAAGPGVPGEASEDVAAAREALRSLESGPVMKVKPSEDEPPSDDSSPLAPPEAPEPPPPAPE